MKLATVINIYRKLNDRNFGGVLEQPVIGFTRSSVHHAYFDRASIRVNLIDTKGIDAVTELVYHEMVHQYIDEFLGIKIKDDHGKEFKRQYNKFSFGIVKDKNYD